MCDWQLIFSTLTTHGRLSARDISQKCLLPPKQVFSGLAVLTECLFVYHHSAPDGRTSYQANQTAAFNLVRVGRFTRLMRREFGPDGVDVLKHLLIFGHDTGDNLQKLSTPIKEQERPNGVDEDAIDLNDPETEQSESMRRVLERLVQQKYLIELRPAHFQTWTDTWRAAELVVKASGSLSLAKGKKGQQELEEAVQEEMDRILSGDVTTNGKRAAADESDAPAAKKLKRANGEQRNGVPAPERLSPLHVRGQSRLAVQNTDTH
jgi:DNA-directed RNA polymerase III subunit RPC3